MLPVADTELGRKLIRPNLNEIPLDGGWAYLHYVVLKGEEELHDVC